MVSRLFESGHWRNRSNLGVVLQKAKFWDEHAPLSLNDRQRKILNKLLDGFNVKLNSSKWTKICKCSSATAVRDINDLIEKGVLEIENDGERSMSY